ncbi:MAG: outer membrane protein transport protein [Bacteroidota bacterium]
MKTRCSFCLLLFVLTFCQSTVLASGLQLHLLAQRQAAMGQAGTALVRDASISFYNPGGLGFVSKQGSLQFGTTLITPSTAFQGQWPSIYQSQTEFVLMTPINAYASWRGKSNGRFEKISFGFSINNPFANGIRWPDDWKGRFISQEFSVNTFIAQPTVSYKFSDEVGIGVGLMYGFGNLVSRRALSVDGINGSEGFARFSGTGEGVGANVGVFFRPGADFSIGMNYRTRLFLSVKEGLAQFNVPESFSEQYPDMGFQTQLKLPWVFNLGVSIRPEDRFLATVDVDYTGWQVLDSLKIDLDQPISQIDLYPAREFIRTISFRIGGEYILTEKIFVRGGAYYDPSPIRQGQVSPDLPDANRIGLTTGLGFQLNPRLSVDLSYVYEFTGERTVSFNAGAFGGTYETTVSSVGLGLFLAFGEES